MPEEPLISGSSPQTVETPTVEPQQTPAESIPPAQESSSNDSYATTATEGTTTNDALKAFEGYKFGGGAKPKVDPAAKPAAEAPEQGELPLSPEPTRPARDYSGLDENETSMFKQMNNKAFAYLKPIYLESKKLKADYETLKAQNASLSKDSFYEHQDAYQLAPEYQATTQNLQLVDKEISFWKSQIANIRNGKPWTALVGYDQQGRPQLQGEQEPTPEAEADILGALQNAFSIRGSLTEKVNTLKTSFSAQHRNYLSGVKSVEESIFKGADQETLTKAMAKKITLFPEHRRGVPEVQIIAKLLAVLDGYQIMLNEKSAAAVTAEAKTRTAINGGPTTANLRPATSKGNTVASVIDEFNKAKANGAW